MDPNTAFSRHTLVEDERRNIIVSFDNKLEIGETIVGTPIVRTESGKTISVDNIGVNANATYVDNKLIDAGRAVVFRVSNQIIAGSPYTLEVVATTSTTPPQTIKGTISFYVTESVVT